MRALLERAGFLDIQIERVDDPMWVATDVSDAIAFFRHASGGLERLVPPDVLSRILATLRMALAPYGRPDGVWLPAAALLAQARKAAKR